MKIMLILAGATVLAVGGAAQAQMPPDPANPTAVAPAQQGTATGAAGSAATPAEPMAPPMAGADAAQAATPPADAPAAMGQSTTSPGASVGTAPDTPRHYPLCTRKLQDECRNRGGV